MIEAAREYLDLGLSVFPVGTDKRPLVEWAAFQTEAPHPDQIETWWGQWPASNIGCATGKVSNLVVLDADGPEGFASLRALETPATTWLSKTGRTEGGYQQFFAHPGPRVGNRARLRPGLDVRGDGGYVILPPSLHASGRRYEWLTGPTAVPLAPLPPAALKLLLEADGPVCRRAPLDAGAIIPQGVRNDHLYRAARALRSRGLGAEALAAALLAENRARCRPPLPDEDVREIARHAATQPDRADFAGGPREVPRPEPPRPLAIGLGGFLAAIFPPVECYVDGVLSSEGGGWIGGEEKLGKTYYALEEGLCLALGLPVCGRFAVPSRRRVLFIEEEDGPRRTQSRLRALLRGHGLDPDDRAVQADLDEWFHLSVWAGFTLDAADMIARLDADLARFTPAVCYLDVLRKLTTRDMNKAAEAGALLAVLDDLRRRYDVIFRVLHHYRKAQGFRVGRGSQEIGGSFVLGAWGESSLFLEPVGRRQGAVRVESQSKDAPPQPAFMLRIESEGPLWAPEIARLIADVEVPAVEVDETVFQAVATLPTVEATEGRPGVTVKAVTEAMKKADKTVRRALDRLIEAERILVTGTVSKKTKLYGVNG